MVISHRPLLLLSRTMLLFASILVLAVPAHAGFVGLTWDPNPEPDIAGYVLFSGTESGTYTSSVDVGNTTTWVANALSDGRQYFFAILAYNTSGAQSGLSGEVGAMAFATAQLTEPQPGAVLDKRSVRFQWSAGNGVAHYRLTIGTSFGGADVLDRTSSSTTAKASGMPSSGTVFVRLWSLIGTTWHFTDYTYTAARAGSTPGIELGGITGS